MICRVQRALASARSERRRDDHMTDCSRLLLSQLGRELAAAALTLIRAAAWIRMPVGAVTGAALTAVAGLRGAAGAPWLDRALLAADVMAVGHLDGPETARSQALGLLTDQAVEASR